MNVHFAGGMRFIDGDIHMGIFDLVDRSFVQKAEALYSDLNHIARAKNRAKAHASTVHQTSR